ncbi:MAG: hypothetical protein ACK49J_05600 [Verrucomicrobiota bacterium]
MKNKILLTVYLAFMCILPCHAQELDSGVKKESYTPPVTRPAGTLIRPENSPQHQALDEAWARYDAVALETAKAITKTIANQLNASTQEGDLDAALKWQANLDNYNRMGTLPSDKKTILLFSSILADFKKANVDLINSYNPLVKSLTINKNIEAAKFARTECDELKQQARAVLDGAIWVENRIKKPKRVIVDRYRGNSRGVKHDLELFKHYGWEVVELKSPITEDILKDCALYYVRHGSNNPIYTKKELEVLFKEYNRGGICMLIDAMTWVWVYTDKQTENTFPGNQLGSQLGFHAPNLGSDAIDNQVAYDGLLQGVKFSHNNDKWYTNTIVPLEISKGKFRVLASDKNNNKAIIAQIDSGLSSTIIIGHCGFLDDKRGDIPKKILYHFEQKMGLR